MIRLLTLAILIFLGHLTVNAQSDNVASTWDLNRCVTHALETNLNLQTFIFDQRTNEIDLQQSRERLLPSLSIESNLNRNIGRSENPVTFDLVETASNSLNMNASGNFTLFQGLQNRYTIERNRINLSRGDYNIEDAKNDLMLNIANAYLTILMNDELLQSAELQLENTQEQRNRTKKLVDAGSLALSELADLNAQIATEELNVTNSRNQLELAYLNLQIILNLNTSDPFRIVKPDLSNPEAPLHPANPDEIYVYAEGNQPDIKSAELGILSAEKDIQIAKGGWMPSLTLFGFTGTRFVSLDDIPNDNLAKQLNDNFNYGYGLNLSIPVYSRGLTRANIDRAEVSKLRAQNLLEITRQNLRQAIEQAHLDAVTSFSQYQQAIKQLDALELALDNTQKQFEVGLANSLDFLISKNNLARAQFDLIRFKYDYIFKSKVLEFYSGNPISF